MRAKNNIFANYFPSGTRELRPTGQTSSLFILVLLLAAPAAAASRSALDPESDQSAWGVPQGRPYVVLRSRAWLTSGTVATRYSTEVPPDLVTPPGGEVFLGETERHHLSGTMLLDSAEVAPLTWLSFEFQYGEDRPHGTYKDEYWIHAPSMAVLTNLSNGATWNSPNHENDLVFGADESGSQDWAAATIYLRVLESKLETPDSYELKHSLDIAAGAERYRQNSRRTNLAIVSNSMKYYSNAPPGPIAGYNSSYQALWQGPHIGLRDSVSVRGGFAVEGLVLWSPFMEYKGQDYENLAAQSGSARGGSPNIADWARGTAIHFDLGASWTWSIVRVEAGYQRLYFYSRTGLRRFYNADGTMTDAQLDFATADLAGAYAGVSLRF